MKKRNVILVGPTPPPVGGVAAMNELIYKGFDNLPYRIILLDTSYYIRKFNITHRTGIINLFFQVAQINSLIYLVIKYNCQMIHISVSSYHSFFKSAIFILITLILGKKIIIHLHGGAFDIFYQKSNSIIKRYIHFIFEKSDCIIALSQYWKNLLIDKIQVTPEKVVILYNCYSSEFNKLEESIEKLQTKRNGNLIRILFVGALTTEKGVLDLIKICIKLIENSDKFIFYLAGVENEKGMIEKVKNAIINNKLRNHIKLLGGIKGENKLELFCKCDLFILPSYIENFPVAILEAMRAGLPVITTTAGAIPEILKNRVNGFMVTAGDIDKFVEKILLLSVNVHLRNLIACKNIKKALNEFNPKYYSFNLMKIYDKILHE